MMVIHEHAVDRYIERIFNLKPEQAGDRLRKRAEEKVKEAVEDPDFIYGEKEGMCPVHVKGEIAIPYDDGEAITTLYSDGFRRRHNGKQRA